MISREHAATRMMWAVVGSLGLIDLVAWVTGQVTLTPEGVAVRAAMWVLIIIATSIGTWRIGRLTSDLSKTEDEHLATREEVAQLQTHSEMLEVLARSVDVPLAFQALAKRIATMVPCDRVGLALLTDENEFQTYTARVNEQERRSRPRPEVVFRPEGTAIGRAVQTREPMILDDTRANVADYLDVTVLHSSGFESGMIIPLIAEGQAVGTLNIVSRTARAFTSQQVDALLPITELLAIAYVAQQLQQTMARQKTMEKMAQLTLSVSTDINSALQTIVGHCDLIERGHRDPALHRDLATVVRQAQRISELLEKMRAAAARAEPGAPV